MTDSDEQGRGQSRTEAFLAEAYALETEEDARAFYGRWSDSYDDLVEHGLRYLAPAKIAAALAKHLHPGAVPILDAGCGTGLTGACLRELGFEVLDGLDLTCAMLDKARPKGIYRALIEADLNVPLELATGVYSAVVSSGTFTLGHVGPKPLDELLRVLAPGGYLACTVHDNVWDTLGFSAAFDALCDGEALEPIERYKDRYFAGGEKIAWYCVFRKPVRVAIE